MSVQFFKKSSKVPDHPDKPGMEGEPVSLIVASSCEKQHSSESSSCQHMNHRSSLETKCLFSSEVPLLDSGSIKSFYLLTKIN